MKNFKYLFLIFVASLLIVFVWFLIVIQYPVPHVENHFNKSEIKNKIAENIYTFQDNWLKKNEFGLWEMYLSGNSFEMGYKNGILTDSLNRLQEEIFINSIKEMIPSNSYLFFLKSFVALFNRNLNKHIPSELLKEIYGVSLFASKDFDYIGNSYIRMLNYHAAHDIGHALQNMNLVACSAFEVKDDKTTDSTMIIGRNMDFSSGDDFAKNKIVVFCKPEEGYKFCYITWAGMIGVVSGMNDQGLVITLNAAKSDIPTSGKMPVSLLARQVLQFSSNIDEAYQIIKNSEVFVSESFLIASAKDRETVVVEKSINEISIYKTNSSSLILTNHFQSKELKKSKLNIEAINDESSMYRLERMKELIDATEKHDIKSVAEILRNQKGLNNKNIGYGNERAVNQLIAHHSVVFKPEKLQIWVSNYPYQLSSYICYNLNDVFNKKTNPKTHFFDTLYTIKEDPFLYSKDYIYFNTYKKSTKIISKLMTISNMDSIPQSIILSYLKLNPNYYYPYFLIGKYYKKEGDLISAIKYYLIALSKEIPRLSERRSIEKNIIDIMKGRK